MVPMVDILPEIRDVSGARVVSLYDHNMTTQQEDGSPEIFRHSQLTLAGQNSQPRMTYATHLPIVSDASSRMRTTAKVTRQPTPSSTNDKTDSTDSALGIASLLEPLSNAVNCLDEIQLGRTSEIDFEAVQLTLDYARLRLTR